MEFIIKKLQSLCSYFLWGGEATGRKGIVAWSNICQPKAQGGLGIKEVLSWNKSIICNYIFDLIIRPSGSIWHTWIHTYVLKGNDIWSVTPKQGQSCSFKNLLKMRDSFLLKVSTADIEILMIQESKVRVQKIY